MRTRVRNLAVLAGVMGIVTGAAAGNSGLSPIVVSPIVFLQHFGLSDCRELFPDFLRAEGRPPRGRNMQRKFDLQLSESNVTFERTPSATLSASPHWSTCISRLVTNFDFVDTDSSRLA